ncbi:sensor histidine kinase [Pedobacter endophyticus]|uniref:histidine kinase n=1 Tax=Pedobacter endophyticus TaxID=2789740 RepID=A0A7S9PZK0_9SPHI|nr:HAMP domain-containing sensor histidine kinase [Pedobacter endophyticus]QPH40608.1 HAMP domain-containing histidine kinase [Pedobacter endophyticus]
MKEIIGISLENEMDLILAHKRTMQVGEQLGLTVATRTTLATAVSEVVRTVIDLTDNGKLSIVISGKIPRFSINANISFESDLTFRETDEGFYYAKRLLPDFHFEVNKNSYKIGMGLGLPRSLKLDEGKIGLLKVYFDTSSPLNAYEEIKNKNSQLNRLTAEQEKEIRIVRELDERKKEFISVASHELKTPITVIKAYTQMLRLLKAEYSDKVGKLVEKLETQTNKLSLLAYQLMDVSKLEHGSLQYDMAKVDLNRFLNETVSMLSNVHSHNKLDLQLGRKCVAMADPLRLEQVFTNLVGNASKYSAKGSVITIATSVSDEEDVVLIKVSDSGIGMSKDGVAKIFDKFYRMEEVASSHPGLGMGLYIASKIVSDHSGKIWVESVQDVGSTFFFTIPLISENLH